MVSIHQCLLFLYCSYSHLHFIISPVVLLVGSFLEFNKQHMRSRPNDIRPERTHIKIFSIAQKKRQQLKIAFIMQKSGVERWFKMLSMLRFPLSSGSCLNLLAKILKAASSHSHATLPELFHQIYIHLLFLSSSQNTPCSQDQILHQFQE